MNLPNFAEAAPVVRHEDGSVSEWYLYFNVRSIQPCAHVQQYDDGVIWLDVMIGSGDSILISH